MHNFFLFRRPDVSGGSLSATQAKLPAIQPIVKLIGCIKQQSPDYIVNQRIFNTKQQAAVKMKWNDHKHKCGFTAAGRNLFRRPVLHNLKVP
ncbi:hypothetical protein BV914_08290 [Neisseria dumasiana]|nr:hypothetical protein BV914_08290 [Neisseria dumasiana]